SHAPQNRAADNTYVGVGQDKIHFELIENSPHQCKREGRREERYTGACKEAIFLDAISIRKRSTHKWYFLCLLLGSPWQTVINEFGKPEVFLVIPAHEGQIYTLTLTYLGPGTVSLG